MYPTHQAYKEALASLGVTPVAPQSLTRGRPDFNAKSRANFNELLGANNLSVTALRHRGLFQGYVHSASQGMYCAWVEALRFGPGLLRLDGGKRWQASQGLFEVYLKSITDDEKPPSEADKLDAARRRLAWNSALEFLRHTPLTGSQ